MAHAHHVAHQSYGVLLLLLVTAAVYVRGWQHRSSYATVIPGWRVASFLAGLSLIWVAIASPMAGFVHELLTAHMAQHLLLMTFAAPLLWLGEPLMPLMHGLPRSFIRVVMVPLLRRPSIQRLGKFITHPAVCWLGAAGTLVGWHIPALFALSMKSPGWHAMAQASFLATGLLFWWPVFQPWPSLKKPEWMTIVYLFLATLPCDILSGFLIFCDRVVYPIYFSSPQQFGMSALQDQQCAGALMWTVVTVIYFIAGGIFTARLLSPQSSQEFWIAPQYSQGSTSAQATRQGMEVV
jgi:putative membrane protein